MDTKAPTGELVTKYGKIHYLINSGAFVILTTDAFEGDKLPPLTINGVEYRATHRMKFADGKWGRESYHYPDLSRIDCWKNNKYCPDPTHAARTAAEREIERVWIEFVSQNPVLRLRGMVVECERNLGRANDALAQKREELDEAIKERDKAEANLEVAEALLNAKHV